jgi:hypothetical protein
MQEFKSSSKPPAVRYINLPCVLHILDIDTGGSISVAFPTLEMNYNGKKGVQQYGGCYGFPRIVDFWELLLRGVLIPLKGVVNPAVNDLPLEPVCS